jgi:hypothetical protein
MKSSEKLALLKREFGSVSWSDNEDGRTVSFKGRNVKVNDELTDREVHPIGFGPSDAKAINSLFKALTQSDEVKVYDRADRRILLESCKWEKTAKRFRR